MILYIAVILRLVPTYIPTKYDLPIDDLALSMNKELNYSKSLQYVRNMNTHDPHLKGYGHIGLNTTAHMINTIATTVPLHFTAM